MCIDSAVVLKEGGGPLCSLDCDPSCRSLSLKVLAQGTNEPLGREKSIPCCPGVMAMPGFSPLLYNFTDSCTVLQTGKKGGFTVLLPPASLSN